MSNDRIKETNYKTTEPQKEGKLNISLNQIYIYIGIVGQNISKVSYTCSNGLSLKALMIIVR